MNVSHLLHYLITFFIIFGCMSNDYSVLTVHFYFNIIVILHWLTNNNKCFLSDYDNQGENGYTQELLEKVFGLCISNPTTLNSITYMIVIIPLYITYSKLKEMCKELGKL